MAKSSAKNSTNSGKFQPGQSGNPSGRPVGSRNRFSQLKEAFVEAFEGIGGVDSLMEWARDNKDKFYPLMVRIFPKEVELEHKGDLNLESALQKAHQRVKESRQNVNG